MTNGRDISPCVLCNKQATEVIEPPRRTLSRGSDPDDPSYSITVLLPEMALCAEHAAEVKRGDLAMGWCDDEQCRTYGELGQRSACGGAYAKLDPRKR